MLSQRFACRHQGLSPPGDCPCFCLRFLSALLIVTLGLGPAPAYALRPATSVEGAGLEELRQGLVSSSGMEEPGRRSPDASAVGMLARPQDLIRWDIERRLKPSVHRAYAPFLPAIAEVIHTVYQDDPRRGVRIPLMIAAVTTAQTLMHDRLKRRGAKPFHAIFLPAAVASYRVSPEFLVEAARMVRDRVPAGRTPTMPRFFEAARTVIEAFGFDLVEWRHEQNLLEVAGSVRWKEMARAQVQKAREILDNGEAGEPAKVRQRAETELPPADRYWLEREEWDAYLFEHLPSIFFKKLRAEAPQDVEEFQRFFDAVDEKLRALRAMAHELGDPTLFERAETAFHTWVVALIHAYVETASSAYSRLKRSSIKMVLEGLLQLWDRDIRRSQMADAHAALNELAVGEGLVHSAELAVHSGDDDYFPGLIRVRHPIGSRERLTIRIAGRVLTLLDADGHYLSRRVSLFPGGVAASAALFLAQGLFEGVFKLPVDNQGQVVVSRTKGVRARLVTFLPTITLPRGGLVILRVQGGIGTFTDDQQHLLGQMRLDAIRARISIVAQQALAAEDYVRIWYPGESFHIETGESWLKGDVSLDDAKARLAQALHLLKRVYPELSLQGILASTLALVVGDDPTVSYGAAADGQGHIQVNMAHDVSPLHMAGWLVHEDQHNFFMPMAGSLIQGFLSPALQQGQKRSYWEKTAAEAVAEEMYEVMSRLAEMQFLLDALRADVISYGDAQASLHARKSPADLTTSERIAHDLDDLARYGEQGLLLPAGMTYVTAMRDNFEVVKRAIEDYRDVVSIGTRSESTPPVLTHTVIPISSEFGQMIATEEFVSAMADEPLRRYAPDALPLS